MSQAMKNQLKSAIYTPYTDVEVSFISHIPSLLGKDGNNNDYKQFEIHNGKRGRFH
jgi:hypothetical protein